MKKYIGYSLLILLFISGMAFATETIIVPSNSISYGAISLTQVPVGAKVYLDGVYIGATPITIGNVAVGTHHLTVELPGYEPYIAYIYVPVNTVVSYIYPSQVVYVPISNVQTAYPQVVIGSPGVVKVEHFMAYITIESAPSASQVYMDGFFRGITDKHGKLTIGVVSAGTHQVVVLKDGNVIWQGFVTLQPGNRVTLHVK